MAKNIKGLFEALNPSQEQKDRMLNSIVSNVGMVDSNSNSKHFIKFTKPLAAMVLICLVVIGSLIFNSLGTNQFSIKAYAMDTEDGQSAMRPMGDQGGMIASDVWLGYFELKEGTISFYIDVGWQIEGENIKKAEITVDDGYFYNKLEKYEFEEIGNTVILEKENIHQGDILYVGYDRPVTYEEREITYHGEDAQTGETWDYTSIETQPVYELIDKIVLHAVVTYDDGETEEKDMIFDASEDVGAVYINLEGVHSD